MSVATGYTPVSYDGDGSTTAFPFTFTVDSNNDIVVTEVVIATGVETVKTVTTHYAVAAGTVTAVTAPAATVRWIISRASTRRQLTDYVENDPLPASTLEAALDKSIRIAQELDYAHTRTLRQPAGDEASIDYIPAKADRVSLYAAYDADGDPIAVAGTTSVVPTTAFSLTLLDDTTAAAARTTLGVPAATGGTLTQPILQSPTITGLISNDGTGGGALAFARKTADESVTSSTTLQDDNHLTFPINTLCEWVAHGVLFVSNDAATTGLKIGVTCPAGATIQSSASAVNNASGEAMSGQAAASGLVLDVVTGSLAAAATIVVHFDIWCLNGATAGSITIQWAQSTSSGTAVTVKKGSFLRAQRIA